MKITTLLALTSLLLTTGCSTMVNNRMQPVSFTAPTPTAFTVTGLSGRTVNASTPAVLTLDSAVGAFRCERYVVTANGNTKTVETTIQPEFWAGAILLDGGIVDMASGNMCKLPGEVRL